jgi:predicted permease
MDPRTRIFLVFLAFSLGSLAAGYIARKRRWLTEHASKPLQLYALLLGWGPVALISFWKLPMKGEEGRQLALLLLAQPVLMLAAAGVMERLTRWMRCTRVQRGVLIIGAGLSNTGFTLGSYLCYALLEPPDAALAYGIAGTMSMGVFIILLFYPIAWHFSRDDKSTLRRLVVESLFDLRALPLYLSAVGAGLNLMEVPPPGWIDRWHVLEVLFFVGGGAAYAGIGLRLRLGDSLGAWRMHLALALVQFAVYPLVTWGLITLLGRGGLEPGALVGDVLMVQSFVPTAINVVILANIFHLDARLASVLWLWNTLAFCVLVLPAVMWAY